MQQIVLFISILFEEVRIHLFSQSNQKLKMSHWSSHIFICLLIFQCPFHCLSIHICLKGCLKRLEMLCNISIYDFKSDSFLLFINIIYSILGNNWMITCSIKKRDSNIITSTSDTTLNFYFT